MLNDDSRRFTSPSHYPSPSGLFRQPSPLDAQEVLCTTFPLDTQEGIKGGLDLAFRFALYCPAPLDERSAR